MGEDSIRIVNNRIVINADGLDYPPCTIEDVLQMNVSVLKEIVITDIIYRGNFTDILLDMVYLLMRYPDMSEAGCTIEDEQLETTILEDIDNFTDLQLHSRALFVSREAKKRLALSLLESNENRNIFREIVGDTILLQLTEEITDSTLYDYVEENIRDGYRKVKDEYMTICENEEVRTFKDTKFELVYCVKDNRIKLIKNRKCDAIEIDDDLGYESSGVGLLVESKLLKLIPKVLLEESGNSTALALLRYSKESPELFTSIQNMFVK